MRHTRKLKYIGKSADADCAGAHVRAASSRVRPLGMEVLATRERQEAQQHLIAILQALKRWQATTKQGKDSMTAVVNSALLLRQMDGDWGPLSHFAGLPGRVGAVVERRVADAQVPAYTVCSQATQWDTVLEEGGTSPARARLPPPLSSGVREGGLCTQARLDVQQTELCDHFGQMHTAARGLRDLQDRAHDTPPATHGSATVPGGDSHSAVRPFNAFHYLV